MSHYVNVSWVGAGKVRDRVTYDSHREEPLPGGQTRELRGIGDQYRALRGNEDAVLKLLDEDGSGFPAPLYARGKLTVNDSMAKRISLLPPAAQERALRDAVEKTFESAWRKAQGVYVLHFHGGRDRPSGHPHVHFVLSAREVGGRQAFLSSERLARFKVSWSRELDRAVDRQLARLSRPDMARGEQHEREAGGAQVRIAGEPPGRKPSGGGRAAASAQRRDLLSVLRGYYMARGAVRHPLRFATRLALRAGTRALIRGGGGAMKAIAERFHAGRNEAARSNGGARSATSLLRGVASTIVSRSFRHLTNAVPLALRVPARVTYSILRTIR